MGVSDLIVGERGHPLDLVASIITGLALGALVLFHADAFDWSSAVLALAAIDIGAGLVSNATRATRESWREKATSRARISFLAVHLTVYPTVVIGLAFPDWQLAGILCTFLLAKVILFWSGQRAARTDD